MDEIAKVEEIIENLKQRAIDSLGIPDEIRESVNDYCKISTGTYTDQLESIPFGINRKI